MKFTPKSDDVFEKEAEDRKAKFAPWRIGTMCDFEILSATDKVSSKGNEMIEVEVKVFNAAGEEKQLTEYLGTWNEYKLKRICEAGGILDKYESGEIVSEDLYYKTGKCKLGIKKGDPRPDGSGNYPDKNVIQEYLKPEKPIGKPTSIQKVADELNDAPF